MGPLCSDSSGQEDASERVVRAETFMHNTEDSGHTPSPKVWGTHSCSTARDKR